MRRRFRCCLFLALSALVLTVSALADFGPKPQLTVRVKNAPAETYYLDLLGEGAYEGPTYGSGESPYSGLDRSYSQKDERAALDENLLAALRAAVPEGWHACTAEGTNSAPMWGQLYPETHTAQGEPLHVFGYMGVPETYRILMVTKSGESWCSDVLTRRTLQSSVTVDWAAKTAQSPPVWRAYALELLSTLAPTLVIEGAVFLLFGYSLRRRWKPFLLVNLATQLGLYLWLGVRIVRSGFSVWCFFGFVPAELVILLVEVFCYRRLLPERGKRRATVYALTANLLSAVVGWTLAEPVWQWIVSIS